MRLSLSPWWLSITDVAIGSRPSVHELLNEMRNKTNDRKTKAAMQGMCTRNPYMSLSSEKKTLSTFLSVRSNPSNQRSKSSAAFLSGLLCCQKKIKIHRGIKDKFPRFISISLQASLDFSDRAPSLYSCENHHSPLAYDVHARPSGQLQCRWL